MAALRSHSRSVLPMLVGIIVLQGVVAMVPHRHGTETVNTTAGLADHWCSLHTTEIFPIAEVHAPTPCLACVVPTPAFDRSATLPATGIEPSNFDDPPSSDSSSSLARRWRHQLRAPPSHA